MPKPVSLGEYVRLAKKLMRFDQLSYIRLILTGQSTEGFQMVDPSRDLISEGDPISFLRYYDTIIGLAENIVVQAPFTIISAPKTNSFLSDSNHLRCPASISVIAPGRALHKIPNFLIGSWGQRHEIYIFFPSLATPTRWHPQLTEEELQVFTSFCLDPAIQTWGSKGSSSDFQAGDALFGAPRRLEDVLYGGKLLPAHSAAYLGAYIRQNALENDVKWVDGCFFMHVVHGTARTIHHTGSHCEAKEALSTHLHNAYLPDVTLGETGEWWIDVGVEITSMKDLCLQWSTSSHSHMVKEVLGIDKADADCITDLRSPNYARDLASHLSSVSGCRMEPRLGLRGYCGVRYFRMFTTDRALASAPGMEFHGTALTTEDAMGPAQPSTYIYGLYNLFMDASKRNRSRACVEVRVPLRHAFRVLQSLSPTVVQGCLMGFTLHEWWAFKAYRVKCIGMVLQVLSRAPAEMRVTHKALLLTAACVWLINSINSRPNDSPASRELMRAVLPLADATGPDCNLLVYPRRRYEEGEELPYIPFGVISLRAAQSAFEVSQMGSLQEIQRMENNSDFLSPPVFNALFGTSLKNIRLKYTDGSWNMGEDESEEEGGPEGTSDGFNSEPDETW